MSDCLRIEIDIVEERLCHDYGDKVVAVDARTNITVPVNGSYSVPKLERLKEKMNEVLREHLPDCLIAGGAA